MLILICLKKEGMMVGIKKKYLKKDLIGLKNLNLIYIINIKVLLRME